MKKLLLLTILLLSILHVNALDTLKVVKVFELETDDYVYNIGTSFNGIGNKRFSISKLDNIEKEYLLRNIKI